MYRDKGEKKMTCQKQGLQFNNDRKRTEDENEACFWSYNFSMCAFFIIILIPSKSLVSLISDKKVEDAATSLQKEKLQSVFLQQKMLENSQYLPMYGSSEFYEWMHIIRLIISK